MTLAVPDVASHAGAPSPTAGSSHPSNGARQDRRRDDIEGLRGIAVLLVVAYHVGISQLSGGFAGVDVFFVLSGYLITGILLGQLMGRGRVDYVQFYARRMRRLLPAATLTLLVVLVAGAILLGPMERIEPALSAIATSLYSSNVFFLDRAVDYFAASPEANPLLHTWSLAVEEQFYLVWPWLVVVGWKLGRSRRTLALLIGIVSVASFVGCLLLTYKRQPWAFFGTPARAWEFGLGGLAVLVPVATTRGARAVWRCLGWIGVAMVVATAFFLRPSTPFPGIAAIIPVVGTSLVLIAGTLGNERLDVGRWLGTRALRWLGGRSYAWYLWHWPVLVFATALWPGMSLSGRIAAAIAALGIAAVTTALLENPIRFHPGLVGRPRLSIAMGFCCTLGAAGIALGAYESALARGGRFWHAAHDRNRLADAGCMLEAAESSPRQCVYGDSTASDTMVLFGDSHAAQWFSALDSVARGRHLRLLTMTKNSCAVARVAMYSATLKRRFDECERWREGAIREIVEMHPKVLVIGQRSRHDAIRVLPAGAFDTLPVSEWEEGLRSTLRTLDSAGIATLLLGDSPTPHRLIPGCLSRAQHEGRPTSACDVPRSDAVDSLAQLADRSAVLRLTHVRLLDLTNSICAPSTCHAMRDGVVVYLDGNHLTDVFVRGLTGPIDSAVKALVASEERRGGGH
jgi:peptidoglycan/LPS O-acetylase OafA/YrhL